jgi:hypothetical protein
MYVPTWTALHKYIHTLHTYILARVVLTKEAKVDCPLERLKNWTQNSNASLFRHFVKGTAEQGDFSTIGRIFDDWAIVFSGQFFENYKSSTNSWATFFNCTYAMYYLILTEMV